MRTGAVQIDAEVLGQPPHHAERAREVGDRLARGPADAGHQLDGVPQQLLVDSAREVGMVFADGGEERRRRVRQVAGSLVGQGELPFDPEGGGR